MTLAAVHMNMFRMIEFRVAQKMDPYEIELVLWYLAEGRGWKEPTESWSDTKELRNNRNKYELEEDFLLLFINANHLIDIEI